MSVAFPIRVTPYLLLMTALLVAGSPGVHADEPQYDLLIHGGRIIDGTGAPWYRADIAVNDGHIVAIGSLADAKARRTIDATELTVVPGFIDMMGQSATPMLRDPKSALNLLTQGITTVNCGEGSSAAPLAGDDAVQQGWSTFAEYFTLLEQRGLPVNVVQTIGHTQIRRLVLGEADRRPTKEELQRMQALVRRAMEDGAIGVSTALIYPPAVYASQEEIADLSRIAGEYGGRYFTHMRNEGDRLLEAIDEAIEIGESAGTPVHIFHLKAAGQGNWSKIPEAIKKIRDARDRGHEVAADIYPYINNGLGIEALIHPRHFTEGRQKLLNSLGDPELQATIRKEMESEPGWENWFRHIGQDWNKLVLGRIDAPEYSKYAGQSLGAIATQTGRDPWKVFFEIVPRGAFALPQSMSDENKMLLMNQDFVSFCTDVGAASSSRSASHPRAYGSFPRLLGRYIREKKAAGLERIVSQASALAANEVFAYDRGRIAVGLAADIVLFDADTIIDRATFDDPAGVSQGVEYVVVNGRLALDRGKLADLTGGRVLRGPGYRSENDSESVSTGAADERLTAFDEMMTSFIEEHGVPGAALAVTRNGQTVYARGYGYADLATREKTSAEHLYRIASVSKPITAVAILQLVESGKLSLDDKVFDVLELSRFVDSKASSTAPRKTKGQPPGDANGQRDDTADQESSKSRTFDERWKEITIEQLLQHQGGWDRGVSYDAMFQSVRIAKTLGTEAPAGAAEVIQFMVNEPLDFDPGTRYAYSNFGYCMLGRVIEKLTGADYESSVRKTVLIPLGMKSTRMGRTRLDLRAPHEVRYYDPNRGPSVFAADINQEVPSAYGAWNLEAMDAHGAWLSTANDLARFAAAFDDPETCKVLKPKSIRTMFARPANGIAMNSKKPDDPYYALGWLVRPGQTRDQFNAWHTGSLPGTATLLVRRKDGLNWVVLFNARRDRGVSHLTRTVDPLVHKAANAVTEWPSPSLED